MLDRNMVDGIITGSHTLEGDEYLKRKKTIVSLDRDFGSGIPNARIGPYVRRRNGC